MNSHANPSGTPELTCFFHEFMCEFMIFHDHI